MGPVLCMSCMLELPTFHFWKSLQFKGCVRVAQADVVLSINLNLVHSVWLQAFEMVLSDGGVLNDNVNVIVLSLAVNFVADDDGGDGMALGSCPRND